MVLSEPFQMLLRVNVPLTLHQLKNRGLGGDVFEVENVVVVRTRIYGDIRCDYDGLVGVVHQEDGLIRSHRVDPDVSAPQGPQCDFDGLLPIGGVPDIEMLSVLGVSCVLDGFTQRRLGDPSITGVGSPWKRLYELGDVFAGSLDGFVDVDEKGDNESIVHVKAS